jgi:hypothetical protein
MNTGLSTRTFIARIAAATLLVMAAVVPSTAAQRRITSRIDDTRAVALPGNLHPQIRAASDEGRVNPSMPLSRMMLTFRLSAAQQRDLDSLLAAQQDSTSPLYHQWLTPEEIGARFGLAQSDLDQVAQWLEARGLTVVERPATGMYIAFSGTAAKVEAAFHTEIHHYASDGEVHYANATEPAIPAALSGVIVGMHGLHNFRMRPHGVRLRRNFTSSVSGNHFLTPGDFATIYNLNPAYAAKIDGTGQSIAIVGQTDISVADVAAFRTASGLPAPALTQVLVPGSADPGLLLDTGDFDEAQLDIEWSGGVAPNATVVYVNSTDVFDSIIYAINSNAAPVISMSYGACEAAWTTADVNTVVTASQLANGQGITIAVASGDSGAADCDRATAARRGPAVDFPASNPFVTGVGGTTFNEGSNSSQYWKTPTTTGGVPCTSFPCGTDIISSAISYIPEVAWNDSAIDGFTTGSGGGVSTLFSKPTWQVGPGVPNDGKRDVPDVSFAASADHDAYLICSQSVCTNGTFRFSDGSVFAVGGTSVSAPAFAAVVALINQKTGHRQGNVNPILYELAQYSPNAFHDITTGNNIMPCVAGSIGCPAGTNSFGFSTGPGYDPVTGLGTLDANVILNSWLSGAPSLTSLAPATAVAGGSAFTLTANGTNFQIGAVVQWNGKPRATTFVSPTQLTASITADDIFVPDTVSVTVNNPGTNGGVSGALPFTITGNNPVPVLTSIAPGTVPAGSAAFTLTVTGKGFAKGSTVMWTPAGAIAANALTTTYVSSTQLTAAVPAVFVANSGSAAVSVVTPAPGGGASQVTNFYIGGVTSLPLPNVAYLPHIVSGPQSGNGYVSKVTITNLSTSSNNVVLSFLTQTGAAAQSQSYNIPAGGTVRFQTPESARFTSPASVQWGIVYSQAAVGANLFFEVQSDPVSATVINTIGFNAAPAMTDFTLPVEMEPAAPGAAIGRTVGLALANPSSTAAVATLKLVDGSGNVLATDTENIPAFGQIAKAVNAIPAFAAVLPAQNFVGSITVSSNVPLASIALEDDLGPFSSTPPYPGRAK